jgi:hypothetical protein
MSDAITDHFDAVVVGMVLTITAPTRKKATQAAILVDKMAQHLSADEITRAQSTVSLILGLPNDAPED